MRGANSEQEINIQATKRCVSRPSAWGRMLLTSALLSLGLSSCATADFKKPALQPKEETKVEQVIKQQKDVNKRKMEAQKEFEVVAATKTVIINDSEYLYKIEVASNTATAYWDGEFGYRLNLSKNLASFGGICNNKVVSICGTSDKGYGWIVACNNDKFIGSILGTDITGNVETVSLKIQFDFKKLESGRIRQKLSCNKQQHHIIELINTEGIAVDSAELSLSGKTLKQFKSKGY